MKLPASLFVPLSLEDKPQTSTPEFLDKDQRVQKKEFRLPSKKKEQEEKKPKVKEVVVGSFLQNFPDNIVIEGGKVEISKLSTSSIEIKLSIDKITALIQQMVDGMRIGQVDGKESVSIDLKTTPEVPHFLTGANLTITQVEKGTITVHFTNLSESNLKVAINVMEQRRGELENLIQNLHMKNITLAELCIGEQRVVIPRVESLTPSTHSFTEREREHGEQGKKEQGDPQDNE